MVSVVSVRGRGGENEYPPTGRVVGNTHGDPKNEPWGTKNEPKGNKREPKGSQKESKGTPKGPQRQPKGPQRQPKETQREPKGSRREPQGTQRANKMDPKTVPGAMLEKDHQKHSKILQKFKILGGSFH